MPLQRSPIPTAVRPRIPLWPPAARSQLGPGLWRLADPKISIASFASMALGAAVAAADGPPLSLSYRGLGELAVALCYGPLIAAGTYLVQRGTVSPEIVLAGVPLGLLVAGFLWLNEIPDARADEAAGKRTLVVRLGGGWAAAGALRARGGPAARLVPAQVGALAAFVLYAAGAAAGCLV